MAAVTHSHGPAEVLAGPGSGKTRVIVGRLKYLISDRKLDPSSILTVTFSKAAALEMQSRAFDSLGDLGAAVNFGTFHAVFYRILQNQYRFSKQNIINAGRSRELIHEAAASLRISLSEIPGSLQILESEFSKAKSLGRELVEALLKERLSLKKADELLTFDSSVLNREDFIRLFRKYLKRMRELRLIDFDDMLIFCNSLFREKPEVLKKWQDKFKIILVDEFQDINPLQYECIRLIAAPQNDLFIVGDDDQSIYGFRGSSPAIMKDFLVDYEDAKLYPLNTNYRSGSKIVEAASKVIIRNTERLDKDIRSFQNTGIEVDIREFENRDEEFQGLKKGLEEAALRGQDPSQTAVLLRTNELSQLFSERFSEFSIPFRTREKVFNIYDHFIAQDILSYLELADGNRSRGLFFRVMNRPYRFISRNSLKNDNGSFEEILEYHKEDIKTVSKVKRWIWEIEKLSQMKPYGAVHFVLNGIGYLEHLKYYARENGADFEAYREICEEILYRARTYKSFSSWLAAIKDYGDKLLAASKCERADSKDAVNIMTMHSSKGLEFDEVYILDCNERVIPYHRMVLKAEIEEERRLFYVAMTRAKTRLHIFYIRDHFGKKQLPSRFLEDLMTFDQKKP